MKAGQTVPPDAFRSLSNLARLFEERAPGVPLLDQVLVYGGNVRQNRSAGTVLPWNEVADYDWFPEMQDGPEP